MEVDASRRAFLRLRADDATLPPRAVIGKQCFNLKDVICDACKDACDARAIVRVRSVGRVAALSVSADLCTACGDCVSVCPADAIAIEGRTT